MIWLRLISAIFASTDASSASSRLTSRSRNFVVSLAKFVRTRTSSLKIIVTNSLGDPQRRGRHFMFEADREGERGAVRILAQLRGLEIDRLDLGIFAHPVDHFGPGHLFATP